MYSVGKSECFVSVYRRSFKAYVASKFLCANNHSIVENLEKRDWELYLECLGFNRVSLILLNVLKFDQFF